MKLLVLTTPPKWFSWHHSQQKEQSPANDYY